MVYKKKIVDTIISIEDQKKSFKKISIYNVDYFCLICGNSCVKRSMCNSRFDIVILKCNKYHLSHFFACDECIQLHDIDCEKKIKIFYKNELHIYKVSYRDRMND